jgi:hypothetical protein
MKVVIPLVQPGEIVDETAWRAYLAPGAFRSLGFVAILLGADKLGRTLTRGLGYPTTASGASLARVTCWSITCPGSMDHFPESELDACLRPPRRSEVRSNATRVLRGARGACSVSI